MRVLLLAVVLILVGPRRSTAEINMADSIEWMTADSDRVVVGRVATLTETPGWANVTFAITETLKGPVTKQVNLMVRQAPAWKADNRERMLFLVTAKRRAIRDTECREGASCTSEYLQAPFALRSGRWGEGDALKLDGSAQAFTITHDVIGKRAELIAAVKAAAGSKATSAFQVDLPFDSPAGRALYGGSAVFLYVPIDTVLEQHAIQWLAATDARRRDQGVQALAHFRSQANIARLEKLLLDPATHDLTEGAKPTVRRYFVRKRAHDVLRAWGVPHTTPPIDTKP